VLAGLNAIVPVGSETRSSGRHPNASYGTIPRRMGWLKPLPGEPLNTGCS